MHQRHVKSLLIHDFLSVNARLLIAFGTASYAIMLIHPCSPQGLFTQLFFQYLFPLNARLAGDHLDGKWLFTWLSLVMSMMVSYFVLSFFPRDVLHEICDRIESVP